MIEFNNGCEEEKNPQEGSEEYRQKVRELNDRFRSTFSGGMVTMTPGIQALGEKNVQEICQKIMKFDAFTKDNDPYGEHDFGTIKHDGQSIFWKIDYYDRNLEFHSPNKSDPAVTTRVMTIMLAEEY